MQYCTVFLAYFLSGWVNTLMGGQQQGARGFMFFIVNVDLTEEGLGNYAYINLIFYLKKIDFYSIFSNIDKKNIPVMKVLQQNYTHTTLNKVNHLYLYMYMFYSISDSEKKRKQILQKFS